MYRTFPPHCYIVLHRPRQSAVWTIGGLAQSVEHLVCIQRSCCIDKSAGPQGSSSFSSAISRNNRKKLNDARKSTEHGGERTTAETKAWEVNNGTGGRDSGAGEVALTHRVRWPAPRLAVEGGEGKRERWWRQSKGPGLQVGKGRTRTPERPSTSNYGRDVEGKKSAEKTRRWRRRRGI